MNPQTRWDLAVTRHYTVEAFKGGLALVAREIGQLTTLAATTLPIVRQRREVLVGDPDQTLAVGTLAVDGLAAAPPQPEVVEPPPAIEPAKVEVEDDFLVPV